MLNELLNLDVLFLNDCGNEDWIKEDKPLNIYEFYGRILDFVNPFNFEYVLGSYCGGYDTHHWFKEKYPNLIQVTNLSHFTKIVPKNSNILVAGAAWNICLHHNKYFSFNNLHNASYNIYSHPNIVDTQRHKTNRVTDKMFLDDNWKPVDNLYLKVFNEKELNI